MEIKGAVCIFAHDNGIVSSAEGGPDYGRLVEGFKWIFTGTIYFGRADRTGSNQMWDHLRLHFVNLA